jgi:hypothetical protein
MCTVITNSAIGLNNSLLLASIALSRGFQGLVLPIVHLPLDDVVTALAQVVKWGVCDLFGFYGVRVVLEFKGILIFLATLFMDVAFLS